LAKSLWQLIAAGAENCETCETGAETMQDNTWLFFDEYLICSAGEKRVE